MQTIKLDKKECGTYCWYIILWLWGCGCPQALTCCKQPKLWQSRCNYVPLNQTCYGRLTFTLQLSIRYWAMDLTKASKKYQEYCRAEKHPSDGNKKGHSRQLYSYTYVTLRSLLLVRKSVEGFKMAVMALASSSCTVRVVLDVYGSVLNTNWRNTLWEGKLSIPRCKHSVAGDLW